MKGKIKRRIANAVAVLCLIIIGISFFSLYHVTKNPDQVLTILNYRPGVIISGSMKPALNPGDMIIAKVTEPEEVQVGDVITYEVEGSIPNTHRVIDVVQRGGKLEFITKGDANQSKDAGLVSEDRLLGTMVLKVPYVGRVPMFLKTKLGFTSVIIIPLVVTAIVQFYTLLKPKAKDLE